MVNHSSDYLVTLCKINDVGVETTQGKYWGIKVVFHTGQDLASRDRVIMLRLYELQDLPWGVTVFSRLRDARWANKAGESPATIDILGNTLQTRYKDNLTFTARFTDRTIRLFCFELFEAVQTAVRTTQVLSDSELDFSDVL